VKLKRSSQGRRSPSRVPPLPRTEGGPGGHVGGLLAVESIYIDQQYSQ